MMPCDEYYQQAIQFPKKIEVWYRLALCLSKGNYFTEAEKALRQSISCYSDFADAWFELGLVIAENPQRLDESSSCYERAIQLDDGHYQAMNNLANQYSKKLLYKDAENLYRKAITISPQSWEPWDGLGHTLYHQSKLAEAEFAFRNSLRNNSKFFPSWFGLATILRFDKKRRKECENAFRNATQLKQDDLDAWFGLGNILSENPEHFKKAEDAYIKCQNINPNSHKAYYGLAELYRNYRHLYEEAEMLFKKSIELNMNWSPSRYGFANLLRNYPERYIEAEKLYKEALAIDPDETGYLTGLGTLLSYQPHRHEEAETIFRKALKIDSREPVTWFCLAELKLTQGFTSKAVKFFNKAVRVDDAYLPGWLGLAIATSKDSIYSLSHESLIKRDVSDYVQKALALYDHSWWSLKHFNSFSRELAQLISRLSHKPFLIERLLSIYKALDPISFLSAEKTEWLENLFNARQLLSHDLTSKNQTLAGILYFIGGDNIRSIQILKKTPEPSKDYRWYYYSIQSTATLSNENIKNLKVFLETLSPKAHYNSEDAYYLCLLYLICSLKFPDTNLKMLQHANIILSEIKHEPHTELLSIIIQKYLSNDNNWIDRVIEFLIKEKHTKQFTSYLNNVKIINSDKSELRLLHILELECYIYDIRVYLGAKKQISSEILAKKLDSINFSLGEEIEGLMNKITRTNPWTTWITGEENPKYETSNEQVWKQRAEIFYSNLGLKHVDRTKIKETLIQKASLMTQSDNYEHFIELFNFCYLKKQINHVELYSLYLYSSICITYKSSHQISGKIYDTAVALISLLYSPVDIAFSILERIIPNSITQRMHRKMVQFINSKIIRDIESISYYDIEDDLIIGEDVEL